MPRRRRHLLSTALAAALCLALLATFTSTVSGANVAPSARAAGAPVVTRPGSVGATGDSVLDISEHDFFGPSSTKRLTWALDAAGYEAEVSGHPGATLGDLTPSALDLRDRGFETIIVGGGHNDLRVVTERGNDPAELARVKADFVHLLDELAAVPCVVFATPRTATPTWDLDQGGPALVAFYRAEAAKHDNVHLADWTTSANPHPEWFTDDGVHPVEAGAIAFRSLVLHTVQTAC